MHYSLVLVYSNGSKYILEYIALCLGSVLLCIKFLNKTAYMQLKQHSSVSGRTGLGWQLFATEFTEGLVSI